MDNSKESLMDIYIFETFQMLEQLEQAILASEKEGCIGTNSINDIFRIMHNIKGSSAMMMFNKIAELAHSIEDLFFYLREEKPQEVNCFTICDLVLRSIDFVKEEVSKLQNNLEPDGDACKLIEDIKGYLLVLKDDKPAGNIIVAQKRRFQAVLFFDDDYGMEDLRAFNTINKLKDIADSIEYFPEDIIESDTASVFIRENGFKIVFISLCSFKEIEAFFFNAEFIASLELSEISEECPNTNQVISQDAKFEQLPNKSKVLEEEDRNSASRQSIISVNVNKLDSLMDLVGELVISEAMVSHNPDLAGVINLDNFNKAARQHRKIINELQDTVMAIRMVPLAAIFQKMNRIVRDMSKKLNKEVELEIIGEETEVDKNIIEHLSDPLMHLIRNAIDHGIEKSEDRLSKGKPAKGKIRLEAKNEGGDVWITLKDDGIGLNKGKILARARNNGLLNKADHELSDREIFACILLPGLSTKDQVSEFSGRGVGMDVVVNNISSVGGTVIVDSIEGGGTSISLKIPLTLAIIDGTIVQVGNSVYIIPTNSIKESFRPREEEIIHDPDGNEMIMVRGDCFPVLRLHKYYDIPTEVIRVHEGIIVIVENDRKSLCLFADGLLGKQQIVVKALPRYLKKINGISGCTLLGNGRASLILDVVGLMDS